MFDRDLYKEYEPTILLRLRKHWCSTTIICLLILGICGMYTVNEDVLSSLGLSDGRKYVLKHYYNSSLKKIQTTPTTTTTTTTTKTTTATTTTTTTEPKKTKRPGPAMSPTSIKLNAITTHPIKPMMLFYNLYTNTKFVGKTQAIVDEQFKVLSQSETKYLISITSIGSHWSVLDMCKKYKLTCTLREKRDNGAEPITLDAVRRYCLKNRNETIIYAHDKGSQHDRGGWNVHLRHFQMRAITSPACQTMPSECNICGASFSPLPYPGFHGNMWVARCSYIGKLPRVPELVDSLKEAQRTVVKVGNSKIRGGDNLWAEMDGVPAGRSTAEYWITSHPDMRPCDLYDGKGVPTWQIQNTPKNEWVEELRTAPRYPVALWTGKRPLSHPSYAMQMNLTNKLLLWKHSYDKVPSPTSWIWKYYPS